MEDQVYHFIHEEHPLELIQVRDDGMIDGDKQLGEDVDCKLCDEPISISSGSSVYGCISSNFYLHKTCGQLKKYFYHPLHPIHPLSLISPREYSVLSCGLCDRQLASGYCYGCQPCKFTVCPNCAIAEIAHQNELAATALKESFYHPLHPFHPLSCISPFYDSSVSSCDLCDRKVLVSDYSYRCKPCKFIVCSNCIKAEIAQSEAATALKQESVSKFTHEGHNHPQHTLIFHSKPAAFLCNACQTEKKDWFYHCDHCDDFLIHKSCATLTPTIDRPHYHQHPLSLVFSLPERFYNYRYTCDVCNKRIMQTEWTYHCSNCRYFIHIKCLPNPDQLPSTDHERLGANDVEEETNDSDEILRFPMSHAYTDPLKLLCHSENADGGDDDFNHWSHKHPLSLTGKNNMPTDDIGHGSSSSSDLITVCDCCVRPLSSPYYSCKHDGCSFSLHKYCFELSRTLQHPLHLDHGPLHLAKLDRRSGAKVCKACDKMCNAFMYKCEIDYCEFHIDVNCAFLPKIIKHGFHKQHHLVQHIGRPGIDQCTICERRFDGSVGYSCDACNFGLDMHCALRSPRSLPHRYCKGGHEVPLMCPPIEDHPEDFYCEICEEEMNPLLPLYYCGKCKSKNSFHVRCLSRVYPYENLLGEVTVSFPELHNHPLTLVRRKKPPKEVCFGCNGDINGFLFLECQTGKCPYCLCLECVFRLRGARLPIS